MHLESIKNDNWKICQLLDDKTNSDDDNDDQFSQTNMKICRFCYVEGSNEIDWLRPCKCSGSMLWVHKQCFNFWLGKASGRSKIQCQICK
uniref:Bm13594 n=1 Tax=Brugia malayi TaxID=6279 RepID=A0A0J9YGH2_BRUMA|nr:Bm13594 [Brugia malayi]